MSKALQDRRLAAAFATQSPDGARRFYDDWAARYDAENIARGIRLPSVGAALLARHLAPEAGRVLDAACGTGLVGETLAALDYRLVGCDLSPEMLRAARQTEAYGSLDKADLTALPYPDGTFAGFICIGAFGPGHAPPEALDELVRVVRPGGIGVFSLREDTYEEQGFPEKVAALAEAGRWRVRHESRPLRTYLLAEPELFGRLLTVEVTG